MKEIWQPPAVAMAGFGITLENVMSGLSLVSTVVTILVGLAGLYWTWLKIRAEKEKLKKGYEDVKDSLCSD